MGAATLGGYVFVVRPWFMHWGATTAEVCKALPGDSLVPRPKHCDTHAITIHAPVAEVWPWLVQIGQDKGGFYSYAWLENLAGCRLQNADRIIAEYQTLQAGDPVRLHPAALPLTAVIVDPCRCLVLMNEVDPTISPVFGGTWGFYADKVDTVTTRLLTRSRWNWNAGLLAWFGYRCLLEPAHFIMERKMLLTLKACTERAGDVSRTKAADKHTRYAK